MPALGQQRPPGRARRRTRAARSPPAAPKRRRCERSPASTCRRRPATVASFGSTAWVAAEAISSTAPSPGLLEGAQRRRPRAPRGARSRARSVGLGVGGRPQRLARPRRRRGRRRRGGARRRNSSIRSPTPSASSWSASTGVTVIVSRSAHLQHRQVGAGERVEQPLLAEGVGPEPLHVGHVAVEDDRQVADRVSLRSSGRRPTKSSALSRSFGESVKSDEPIAGMKRS